MSGFVKLIAVATLLSNFALAANNTVEAVKARKDVPLNLDPNSKFWKEASAVHLENDRFGRDVGPYRSEVRVRWTKNNLYFLFICPYEQLYVKPEADATTETYGLWNWDVAEVFLGSDFSNIKRYKEFEVSPQGEWIDLDIDLDKPHHEEGWKWNSGFKVMARNDPAKRIWYGAMKIPYSSVDSKRAASGNKLRMNLFRSQGPPAKRHEITWQAPMTETFHTPEQFGILQLAKHVKP